MLAFRTGEVEHLQPQRAAGGEGRYATAVDEFALSVIDVHPGAPWRAPGIRNIEILLCTAGRGRLVAAPSHEIARGDCFLVPAAAPAYTLEGDLTLYRATPGI